MTWRPLGYDYATGLLEQFKYDELTGESIIRTVQPDVTPHKEYSKALAKEPDYWKQGVKNDFAHYAHIPNGILLQWRSLGVNITDPKALTEMVNKPEWRYLKCTDRHHS